jgi:hypothetical protein
VQAKKLRLGFWTTKHDDSLSREHFRRTSGKQVHELLQTESATSNSPGLYSGFWQVSCKQRAILTAMAELSPFFRRLQHGGSYFISLSIQLNVASSH